MKKKMAALLLAMSMSLTFTSCGINEADYNSAKEKNSKLESQLEDSKALPKRYKVTVRWIQKTNLKNQNLTL